MTPKVYVINEPLRRDHATGGFGRFLNIRPAAQFGELVYVLPAGQLPADPQPSLTMLHEKLSAYTPADYLLLIGEVTMIGAAAAIAAHYAKGTIQTLRWEAGNYTPQKLTLWRTKI